MGDQNQYDYRELAYDLHKAAGDLLEDLVALRKSRCMTQRQLAAGMNVSQSYVSQIENGETNLVSLLTDYGLFRFSCVCWVHGCEICSCMVCLNPPACRRLLVM